MPDFAAYGTGEWVLLGLLVMAWLVQLSFWLGVFTRLPGAALRARKEEREEPLKWPRLTVVVAARDRLAQTKALLQAVLAQDYPDFEVVLVDDRSEEDFYVWGLGLRALDRRVRYLRVDQTPPGMNGKKWAMTLGIRAAETDWLVFTDNDCQPAGGQWLRRMAEQMGRSKNIVLGYSPYGRERGLLNAVVRYETLYTGIQYNSLALAGMPYMGVGRNLAYRKQLFMQHNGFAEHIGVTGGDDDLFVNRVANGAATALCLHPDGYVLSRPTGSWLQWWRQKQRHIAVSRYYKARHQVVLGLLGGSHEVMWAAALAAAVMPGLWVPLAVIWGSRWLAQGIVFDLCARRLDSGFRWYHWPVLDGATFLYNMVVGLPALLRKQVEWN